MDINPVIFQLHLRPPLTLPSEQLDLWSEVDKFSYNIWQGNGIKNTKEIYRQFVTIFKKDYNMEEIYHSIEAGLSG